MPKELIETAYEPMTVKELKDAMDKYIAEGHGDKSVVLENYGDYYPIEGLDMADGYVRICSSHE